MLMRLALAFALAVDVLGCSAESVVKKELAVPFSEMETQGEEARFFLVEGNSIDNSVNLTLFEDFAGTKPLWEYMVVGDLPAKDDPIRRRDWYFERNLGRVRVSRLFIESEGPGVEKWELWFIPTSPIPLSDLELPLSGIPELIGEEISRVVVGDLQGRGLLAFDIEAHEVTSLYLAYPGRDDSR
jgi:hypothetical protein